MIVYFFLAFQTVANPRKGKENAILPKSRQQPSQLSMQHRTTMKQQHYMELPGLKRGGNFLGMFFFGKTCRIFGGDDGQS